MNRLIVCNVVILYILFACVQETPKDGGKIEIGESEDSVNAANYWKYIQIIPLNEDSTNILGQVSQIRCNSKYYVLSNEIGRISVFDLEGNSVTTFNRHGNAHNEYLSILDFDVTEDSIYILCVPNSKIIVSDMKGKFHRVIDTDKNFTRLACYDGNLYGYTPGDRALYVCNDDNWVQIVSDGELPSCPRLPVSLFYKTDGKLFYFPEGGDKMYEVDNDKAAVLFTIDYPDKDKIEARMKEDRMYDFEDKIKLSPPHVYSFVSTNESYIMIYSSFVFYACIIDKENCTLQKNGGWLYYFPMPKVSAADGCLAAEFISKDDMPIDTTQIKVSYTREPDWENGQLAIIKYLNDDK